MAKPNDPTKPKKPRGPIKPRPAFLLYRATVKGDGSPDVEVIDVTRDPMRVYSIVTPGEDGYIEGVRAKKFEVKGKAAA